MKEDVVTLMERLERRVGEIVRRVIAELPLDLRTLAERVPVFCEWEMAAHWLEEDEEVRITYIHEFGHYLGLDESELESRGLL